MIPFVSKSWSAHEVHFPRFSRTVYRGYYSLRSQQFHKEIVRLLGHCVWLKKKVTQVKPDEVHLESGERLKSRCVIDGRGWPREAKMPLGFQKFLGLEVRLTQPHGHSHPLLMDVTEKQKEGFRFFYLLPWTKDSFLIEDTRYSDSPDIEVKRFRSDIMAYIQSKGWEVSEVIREEVGVLPIPLEGKVTWREEGVALSGTKAGLFHATTGYSLPEAVRFADELAQLGRYEGKFVYQWATEYAEKHWQKQSFFRRLNRMLFRATEPENRFKVLQKFYQFSEDFIGRFYAGQMKSMDHIKMFTGRPPVSITKAVGCFFERKVKVP